ncbi:MAG: Redox-sensitive transcriptional regulator (AT-rich DNA-binding protein), partial [uncultured Solirubrobacteraceae bacterium]
ELGRSGDQRQRRRGVRRGRGARGSPHPRRRGAPVALPAGAHPGAQDGQGDDLLAGALRVHAHQLDADPARPVGLRQVRQARRRIPRGVAGLADPQDPAHQRAAQHRAVRRRLPGPGDRLVGHLRRPRIPRGGDLRSGRGEDRPAGRAHRHPPSRRPPAGRRGGGHRGGRPRRADGRRAGPGRRAGRRGREDHLQLLRGAAQRPAGGDGAHLQPRGRPPVRALLLPHL